MTKKIAKRMLAFVLAVAVVAGLWIMAPKDRDGVAGEAVTASPSTQKMWFLWNLGDDTEDKTASKPSVSSTFLYNGVKITNRDRTDMSQYIPVYSIIQPNGYGANYVKLRDVAALVNFNVQWRRDDPNAMYIWTNNHYAEAPVLSGPATGTKIGEWSDFDIYVDGKKVEGMQPVMIENNNYFKIRDIARMVGFGCIYDERQELVYIDGTLEYVDESVLNAVPADDGYYALMRARIAASPKRSISFMPVRPTYGSPSGTVTASKITMTENDPWARENYFDKYASQQLKDVLKYDPTSDSAEQIQLERTIVAEFNAMVQRMVDGDMVNEENYVAPRFELYYEESGKGVTTYTETNGHRYNLSLPNMDTIKAKLREYDNDSDRIRYLAALVCNKSIYQSPNTIPNSTHNSKTVKELVAEAGYDMYTSGKEQYKDLMTMGGDFFLDTDKLAYGACGAFTGRFYALARAAGYYAIDVSGLSTSLGTASHAWNYVWLPDEAKWVGVDCTALDGSSSIASGMFDGVDKTFYWDRDATEDFFQPQKVGDNALCFDVSIDDGSRPNRRLYRPDEQQAMWLRTECEMQIIETAYAVQAQEYRIPDYIVWKTTNPEPGL